LASCAWGALRVCLPMVLAGRGQAQRNVVNAAGIYLQWPLDVVAQLLRDVES
jgi:hypothetical protein